MHRKMNAPIEFVLVTTSHASFALPVLCFFPNLFTKSTKLLMHICIYLHTYCVIRITRNIFIVHQAIYTGHLHRLFHCVPDVVRSNLLPFSEGQNTFVVLEIRENSAVVSAFQA